MRAVCSCERVFAWKRFRHQHSFNFWLIYEPIYLTILTHLFRNYYATPMSTPMPEPEAAEEHGWLEDAGISETIVCLYIFFNTIYEMFFMSCTPILFRQAYWWSDKKTWCLSSVHRFEHLGSIFITNCALVLNLLPPSWTIHHDSCYARTIQFFLAWKQVESPRYKVVYLQQIKKGRRPNLVES